MPLGKTLLGLLIAYFDTLWKVRHCFHKTFFPISVPARRDVICRGIQLQKLTFSQKSLWIAWNANDTLQNDTIMQAGKCSQKQQSNMKIFMNVLIFLQITISLWLCWKKTLWNMDNKLWILSRETRRLEIVSRNLNDISSYNYKTLTVSVQVGFCRKKNAVPWKFWDFFIII